MEKNVIDLLPIGRADYDIISKKQREALAREGICGRMCDACTWKEQLDCPGCQDGPGRRFSGGCPIADCCREKGHTACVTCTFSTGCALRRRDMPQNRLWAVEAERERRARLDRNAPVLAKWLWLLFWLVIPSVFSNILTMDTVAGAFPTAGVVGNVLAFLISLAYGVLLWQLREAAGRYRTAALCYLAGGIISGVLLLPAIPEGNWLWWLLSLPVMVLELCAAYQESYAHAEVLEELDPELAGKWRLLWKWWIGLLLGLFGCIFLALISAILGLLAMLADAIGLLVVGIVKLVADAQFAGADPQDGGAHGDCAGSAFHFNCLLDS